MKDKYIVSMDYSNGKDYGCKVEGYKDKDGKVYITNIKWY